MAVKGHHFFTVTRDLLATDALGVLLEEKTQSLLELIRIPRPSGSGRRRLRRSVARISARLRRRYQRMSALGRERLARSYEEFARVCGLCFSESLIR